MYIVGTHVFIVFMVKQQKRPKSPKAEGTNNELRVATLVPPR